MLPSAPWLSSHLNSPLFSHLAASTGRGLRGSPTNQPTNTSSPHHTHRFSTIYTSERQRDNRLCPPTKQQHSKVNRDQLYWSDGGGLQSKIFFGKYYHLVCLRIPRPLIIHIVPRLHFDSSLIYVGDDDSCSEKEIHQGTTNDIEFWSRVPCFFKNSRDRIWGELVWSRHTKRNNRYFKGHSIYGKKSSWNSPYSYHNVSSGHHSRLLVRSVRMCFFEPL